MVAIVGCAGSQAPASPLVLVARPDLPLREGEVPIGTPGRSHIIAASIERRWAVLLQARSDTNHDGVVCSMTDGQHGFEVADQPSHWLIRESGPGEPIDELYGVIDDRYLVLSQDDVVAVLDVESGRRTPLGPRTIFTRWDHFEPTSSASVHGSFVVYRRSDREAVVYDVATDTSRTIPLPGGWLHRAEVHDGWLVAEVLDRAPTDIDGTSELPHMPSSAGNLECRLVDGPCEGIHGTAFAISLTDPTRVVTGDDHGLTVTSWALVRGAAQGQLELVRARSGHVTSIGGPRCEASLLTLGHGAPYVVYRCELDPMPHLLVFSEDELAPPRDDSARLAAGTDALMELGIDVEEAEQLANLGHRMQQFLFFGSRAAESLPIHAATRVSDRYLRPRRCGDPVDARRDPTVAPPLCAVVGPTIEIAAALPDGRAIAYVARGDEPPACPGDDTQVVWTTVRLHQPSR